MAVLTGQGGRVPMGPGGEFDLIRHLLGPEEPLPSHVLLGPGDDCAVLEGGWVVSTDMAVEGVHFRREWISLAEAGYRAAAAALSDVAAMAADPVGVLPSMALDPATAFRDARDLQEGIRDACGQEGVQVLGGDLTRSPGATVLNIVALGRAESPVTRGGTEVGDELWVTGYLGGSGGAVFLWNQGRTPHAALREAFVRPRPRIREGLWLSARVPLHGLIDLSDGLAGDAGHLSAAAGVGLVLEETAIPLHPALLGAADTDEGPLRLALEGGEDYELCFTVPPKTLDQWLKPFQDTFGVPLTRIGWAVKEAGVFLEVTSGALRPLIGGGFNHFSPEEEG